MAAEGVVPAKRSRSNTRARLLAGAFDVFADRGFQAATIEDVCEAAGFTRGAFYSNFSTLDELFLALWDRQAETLVTTVGAAVDQLTCRAEVDLDLLVDLVSALERYDRRWFLIDLEFMLYAMRHDEAAEALARHRAWLRAELARVIDLVPGVDERRRALGVDREEHARLVVAAFMGALTQTLIEPDQGGRDGLARRLLVLLVGPTAQP